MRPPGMRTGREVPWGTGGPFRCAYGRPGPRGSVATMRVIASSAMAVRMPASAGDMMPSLSVNVGGVTGSGDGMGLAVNDDGSHGIVLPGEGGVNAGVNAVVLFWVRLAGLPVEQTYEDA